MRSCNHKKAGFLAARTGGLLVAALCLACPCVAEEPITLAQLREEFARGFTAEGMRRKCRELMPRVDAALARAASWEERTEAVDTIFALGVHAPGLVFTPERLEGAIQSIDVAFGKAASSEEKSRAVWLMERLGRRDPGLVFTPERVERVSRDLLAELGHKDGFLVMSIANFLMDAAESGRLKDPDTVKRRITHAFVNPPLGRSYAATSHLVYALLHVAPHDPEVRRVVRSGTKSRTLLAAAGDATSLLELFERLKLDDRSAAKVDPEDAQRFRAVVDLDTQRWNTIEALGKARDCRAVGVLIDVLSRKLPVPQDDEQGGLFFEPLSRGAVNAVRNILLAYPDIIKADEIPETEEALLKWWAKEGRKIPGLDIRKSSREVWRKRYPEMRVEHADAEK